MKTKFNRLGKSSLSIMLAVMMLFSSVLAASNETIDTTAKAIEAAVNDVAENETDAADSSENDSAAENTEPAQQPEQTVKAAKTVKTTPEASGEAQNYIYFYNDQSWSNVYCYFFGGSDPSGPSWPGNSMEDLGYRGKYKLYRYNVGNHSTVIFNKGSSGTGNQSNNTPVTLNGVYSYKSPKDGSNRAANNHGSYSDFKDIIDQTATTKTVYFYNSNNWNSVKCYSYDSPFINEAWPGASMTPLGNNWYSYNTIYSNVIFTGYKSGTTSGTTNERKTGDLTTVDGEVYNVDGDMGVTYTGWQSFQSATCSNKVYFKKPSGWGTPKCYAWYGPTNNTWPGVTMTPVSGETDIYECTLEKPYKNVIFVDSSNDSNKTNDQTLTYTENTNNLSLHYYDYDNNRWLATYPSTAQATYVEQSYTVYFDNKENPYDEVYAYPYANDNASLDTQTKIADWPGVEMTYDSSTKLYSATFTMKHRENIDTPKIQFSNHGIAPNELRDATDTIPSAKLQTKSYTLVSNNVYTALLAENNSGTTKTAYGTPADVSDVYVSGRFQKKVGNTVTTTYKSGSSSGWTTSALPEFKFTETATSGVFKFETGLSVAELTAQYTPSGSSNSYDKEFFIIYNDNKGSHRYQISGDSNRVLTMTDEQTAIAMTPYSNRYYQDDEGHKKSLIINKNLIFNDNYSSGTVNLFYDINSNVFWFEVTGNNHYTLTAASANASNFDFTTKSVSGGSTQKVRILNTPPKQVVDAVTLTYHNGETLTATPEGNGYYSFAMPTYDATISVTFRNRKTYTVTTAVNNSTLGSVVLSAETVKEGDSVTLKANPAFVAQNSTKAIDFTSWSITSGTGSYAEGYSTTDEYIEFIPTSDVKLTATFTETQTATTVNYYVLYSYTEDSPDKWANGDNTNIHKIKDNSVGNYFDIDLTSNSHVYFTILNANSFSVSNIVNNSKSITDNTDSVYSSSLNTMSASEKNYGNSEHTYPIELKRKDDFRGSVRVYITDGAANATTFKAVPRVSTLTSSTTGGVTVYAKDGTIREEYQKYDQLADTSITKVVDIEGNIVTNQRTKKPHTYYDKWTGIEAGDVITIKTELNSGYSNKYYVKAFCINGVSHSLYGENEEPGVTDTERTTGTYTMDYKVPDGVKYLEITPIYFYLEKGGDYSYLGFIKFRVENFTGEIVNEWGNTISCQVWYTNGSEKAAGDADNKNALGGYPGQPLISSGTYYYTQVPKAIPKNYEGVEINANTEEKITVQGMTLNNYYWDSIHQDLSGKDSSFKGVNNTRSGSAINSQSYDYNDFAALAKMGANDIIFTMKYETKTANKDTTSTNVNTYQNRFHGFVDYFDRGIDLFGHILHSEGETNFKNLENTSFNMTYADYNDSKTYSESDIEGTTVFADNQKLWIVSRGYQAIRNNVSGYYGNYATVWDIYTRSGETLTKVGSLPGSCLIPNATGYKTDSNGDLPTSGNDYNSNKALFLSFCSTETARSAAADKYFSDFVTLYNSYRGVPAMITYEKAIAEAGVQNDMGLRSDGRWYYSAATGTYPLNPNPAVKADLRIQFRDLKNGSTTEYDQAFTTEVLTLTDGKAIGGSTGAKVWFTAPSTGAALIKNAADNQDDNNTRLQVSADYSDTESFEFKADSLVVKNNKVYVFRGWQVELANVTPLNSDDETNTTGSATRNANNSFIARYEEIAATDSVIVSHEILKNNTTDANAKSGGNGAVYVSVEVQTSTGGHVYTYPTTDGTIPIDPVYLTQELGYKFKITLSNEPEETSHFVDSYESDGTTSLNNQTFTLTRTEIINKKDVNTNIVKYLTDFAKNILNLHFNYYDRPDSGVQEYEDVTTLRTVNISVNYKNGQTTENIIMETMTGNAEVADGNSAVSVSSIRNIMDDYKFWTTQAKAKEGIEALDNLHNPGCTYGNTTNALTQYHTDNHGNPVFQDGENYYYGSVAETNKITDFSTTSNRWVSYKLQNDEMLNDNDQTDPSQVKDIYLWAFNYPREYTVRYHYPQILTKTVTNENNEEVTVPDLAVLVDAAAATGDASTKLPSNVYFVSPTDTKNPIASVKSYYQQRVGAATDLTELRKAYLTPAKKAELKSEAYNELNDTQKTEYNALETDEAKEEYMAARYETKYVTYLTQKRAEIDAVGGHIGNYGVTQGYAGATYYDTKEEAWKPVGGNGEIRAASNALYDTGTKDNDDNIIYGDLVFDGWYDAATGKKVSSSELYGYRINVGMDLYAGYVVAENKNTDIGVTVTQLDDDDFIVDVAEGTYKNRTRYNTQLNVYNSPDNNTNITDTVVVYVQLPITPEHTTSWWKEQFVTYPDVTNNLRENIQGHLNNDNKITNGKYKAFGEEITWNSTTVAVKESGFAYPTSTLGLNNKNSVHYTINFDLDSVKESKANSAILVFAGIKINDNWIVSENAADHINAEVPSSGED